jgi:MFS family permease
VVWGLFPSFGGIVAGQVILGVGYTFISGALEAWLADEVGEEEAARLYPRAAQYRQVAAVVGTLLGAAAGLLDHRIPFIVGGAGYALLALPLAMTMTEAGFRPVPRAEGAGVWSGLAATARGGLAAAAGNRAVHLDSWRGLVCRQDLRVSVRVPVGSRHVSALPLRSADAAGVESVPADLAVHGGRGSGIPPVHGVGLSDAA